MTKTTGTSNDKNGKGNIATQKEATPSKKAPFLEKNIVTKKKNPQQKSHGTCDKERAEIGSVKNANLEAALNLEVLEDNTIRMGLSPETLLSQGKVERYHGILRRYYGLRER